MRAVSAAGTMPPDGLLRRAVEGLGGQLLQATPVFTV